MAQHAHVPKFGNWDGENIPYTRYFETARREKGAGSKIFNPNDPEENAEAYNPGTYAQDHQHSEKHHNDTPTDHHVGKQHRRKHHSREDGEFQGYMQAPLHHRSTSRRVNMGRQRSRNHGSKVPVSSSVKSNSSNSLLQPQYRRMSTKDTAERGDGFSSSSLHHATPKTGNSRAGEAQQHRAPSVPKFGSWDEADPKSAESFTVIFNRIKEEKQKGMASTKLPAESITFPVGQNNHGHASSKSKMCCCLFPTAAE